MPLDGNEAIAVAQIRIVIGGNALLLLADVAPDLIAFNISNLHIADLLAHNPIASLTGENQELEDDCVMNFGNALDARYAIPFKQEPKNNLGLLNRQIHAINSLVTSIREYLAALRTLIALAITAFPKLSAIDTT
ncbi:MAG: hypothetical protein WB992_09970 [Bryobacteraceae bacterium]